MTNINLTAVLPDRDLTAPERTIAGAEAAIHGDANTRVTRAGNTRITRAGNTRVTRGVYTGKPLLLTAVLTDRDLTAPERY